jgi:DNA-binding transcriptional LysR family regulator
MGELTIGCANTSGRYFIPNLLARFQQEYPNIRTRMILMRREAVIQGLLDQTLNLGVFGHCMGHRDLECQPVFEDRIILIVPSQHPWANVTQVKPAEILEQRFISRELSSGTYKELLGYCSRKGVNPENLNVVMELGDAEAVQMAVENGIGITFISEVMAARSLALGRVKKVEVEDFNITQSVSLSRHIARVYTRAETKLWEFVQQHRKELASDLLSNLADVTQS